MTAAPPRPSARWLGAWLQERFPAANSIFFGLLYAMVLIVSRAASRAGPVSVGFADLPGLVAVCSFFLLLRVYDEHKDYDADLVAHPQRVLQRGLVTLGMLRWIGVAAVAVQLSVSLWRDGGVGGATLWWAAAFLWSALMAREFFAGEWLRARIVIYALSHMLVMPLVVAWNMALAGGEPGSSAFAYLATLVFAGALAFEIARKLRAPADEHPMAASYTQSLGVLPSAVLLLLVVLGMGIAAILIPAAVLGVQPRWLAPVVGHAVAAAAVAALIFGLAPTRRSAKASEALVGYALVVSHVAVIGAMIDVRGLVWR